MKEVDHLTNLRNDIKVITEEILNLVSQHKKIVEEVGRIKKIQGLPIEDIIVEENLKRFVQHKSSELGIDPILGVRLLNILLSNSIQVQKNAVSPRNFYSPADMLQRAKKISESGKKVIHLETGEPDFPPPSSVIKKIKESIDLGHFNYTDSTGIESLKNAVAEHLNEKLRTDLKNQQVLITHGARFGLYLAIASNIQPGDEVLLFEPAYPAYRRLIELFGGRVISIQTTLEEKWVPDFDMIENRFKDIPRFMIINYPANPTGKVLSKRDYNRMLEFVVSNKIKVLSDEVYIDYNFSENNSILQHQNCDSIFVSSFSKSYSMTGFRIGYMVSDKEAIGRMGEMEGIALTCIPEYVQQAAIKALESHTTLKDNVDRIRKRVEYATELTQKLHLKYYKPEGGLYIFPSTNKEKFRCDEYAISLLNNYYVSVTPGLAFGNYPRHIRISLCQPQKMLEEAFRRMETSFK